MTRVAHCIRAYALTAGLIAVAGGKVPDSAEPAAPATPREFYNAGTRKLREGKLGEAEPLLESALAAQQAALRPPALYNLGHLRFGQGLQELKKSPPAAATLSSGQTTSRQAGETIRSAAEALAGNDLQTMVDAYLRGRGRRRELNAVLAAVRAALETHRATLGKWQRSAGDFRSALELNQSQADARFNAEVVDRCDRPVGGHLEPAPAARQRPGGTKTRTSAKSSNSSRVASPPRTPRPATPAKRTRTNRTGRWDRAQARPRAPATKASR